MRERGVVPSFCCCPLFAVALFLLTTVTFAYGAVVDNTLLQMRFIALSLSKSDERERIVSSLVQAHLHLGQMSEARKDLKFLRLPLWRSYAFLSFSLEEAKKKRFTSAVRWARKALSESRGIRDQVKRNQLSARLSVHFFRLKDAVDSVRALRRIVPFRLQMLVLSSLMSASRSSFRRAVAPFLREVVRARLRRAFNLTALLNLSRSQVDFGDRSGALRTLRDIQNHIEKRKMARDKVLSQLAIGFIYARDHPQAMAVAHHISDPLGYAWALSSVGRILGEKGDMDSALPLVFLALDRTALIKDQKRRDKAFEKIMQDQALLKRYADAFLTVGRIKDRRRQALALRRMADIAIAQKNVPAAQKLLDYIPYLALRLPVFMALAQEASTPEKASQALLKALIPVDPQVYPPDKTLLPEALFLILSSQTRLGDPRKAKEVADKAEALLRFLPKGLERLRAQGFLAIFYAENGHKSQALSLVGIITQLVWSYQDKSPLFYKTLLTLVEALLLTDDPIGAFNLSLRLPHLQVPYDEHVFGLSSVAFDPQKIPLVLQDQTTSLISLKFAAFISVAMYASTTGNVSLALRVAQAVPKDANYARLVSGIVTAIGSSQNKGKDPLGRRKTVLWHIHDQTRPRLPDVFTPNTLREVTAISDAPAG